MTCMPNKHGNDWPPLEAYFSPNSDSEQASVVPKDRTKANTKGRPLAVDFVIWLMAGDQNRRTTGS